MAWKKKKKEEEELKARLQELKDEELDKEPEKPKLPEKETPGEFSLDEQEMDLAVTALAERPELKVYNDFIIGQKIAAIITEYNKVVGKNEVQSSETLPTK